MTKNFTSFFSNMARIAMSLVVFALGFSAQADTETFEFSGQGLAADSYKQGEITIKPLGGFFIQPIGLCSQLSSNDIQVISEQTITKVEFVNGFTESAPFGNNYMTCTDGSMSYEAALITWTGEASSLNFTMSNNTIVIKQIIVTYGAATPSPAAEFEAYKTTQKEAIDAMIGLDVLAVFANYVEKAQNDIDAIVYDEEKTLDDQKAAVDEVVTWAQNAHDALARQKTAMDNAGNKYGETLLSTVENEDYEGAEYATIVQEFRTRMDELMAEYQTISANAEEVNNEFGIIDGIDTIEGAFSDWMDKLDTFVEDFNKAVNPPTPAEEFEAYVAEQVKTLEAMLNPGLTPAEGGMIDAAIEALNALTYNEEISLEENKAAADAIVTELTDALAARQEAIDTYDTAFEASCKKYYDTIAATVDNVIYAEATEAIAEAQEALGQIEQDLTAVAGKFNTACENNTITEESASLVEELAGIDERLDEIVKTFNEKADGIANVSLNTNVKAYGLDGRRAQNKGIAIIGGKKVLR